MTIETRVPDVSVLPSLIRAYVIGTSIAAVMLHVVVAIVAPGDAGTRHALTDGVILFFVLLMVGMIGLVAFPAAALISWPLRGLVLKRPLLAAMISTVTGFLTGSLLTVSGVKVGPGDFYSGSLVGLTFGLVWFFVVRNALRQRRSDDA